MQIAMPRIAIVEDNDDLREELTFFLQHRGYPVWGAASAEQFWKWLHRHPADIVLIDIGLPGEDGFAVVQHLHEMAGYGLIVITARGGEREKLKGLNLGADLFLVKPVNFADLGKAVDQLWLRMGRQNAAGPVAPRHDEVAGTWRLNASKQALIGPSSRTMPLSGQEFALLQILLKAPNQVFSRDALHRLLFDHEELTDTHRIDVILSRLRKKARCQDIHLPIRSIFGQGIVFVGTVDG